MNSSNRTLSDISALSAGTIATISGLTEYDAIDRLRARLWQFACGVMHSEPDAFKSWSDAWARFVLVEADFAIAVVENRGVHTPTLDFSTMPHQAVTSVLERLERSGSAGDHLAGVRFLRALQAASLSIPGDCSTRGDQADAA